MNDNWELRNESTAEFSSCLRYRYQLRRRWDSRPMVGWLLCNPSTADAEKDDPTIRRCCRYASAFGYGGVQICNVYGFRSTDPKALWQQRKQGFDIVGDGNDAGIAASDDQVDAWILAYGGIPKVEDATRARQFLVKPQFYLALTQDGTPKHPLYLPKTSLMRSLSSSKI